MSENNYQIGDTVYLFETDPKCETIYQVVEIHQDGRVLLYHPAKPQTEAYDCQIKHSIY